MTLEAQLLLSHAIDHGDGLLEIPSASFIVATRITRARVTEPLPPD